MPDALDKYYRVRQHYQMGKVQQGGEVSRTVVKLIGELESEGKL
jgi:hypothetical protein